ncbi:MAG: SPOR domain-containing protein [Bacteroidetes bacterium]|nr:SPOR domain-containing protein [Bacteroidota bacterium]
MLKSFFTVLLLVGFSSAAFSAAPVFCKRNFSSYQLTDGGEILVTVEINKGAATGIAKFVEDIPFGLKAFEGESVGGTFSFEQQKLKIVWLNIPSQQVFTVTYKLKASGELNKDYHIVGRFLYVVADSREEFILSDAVLFGKATAVDTTLAKTLKAEEIKAEEGKNYIYKVQLGAYSVKKDDAVFKGLQEISVEESNGVYRYFTGSFTSKDEAVKRAQEAKDKGFPGAHVKPFKDGKMVLN